MKWSWPTLRLDLRNCLQQWSATFLMPWAASAICVFDEGRKKKYNMVDIKGTCMSLTQKTLFCIHFKADNSFFLHTKEIVVKI
jgi:hypothetical protein